MKTRCVLNEVSDRMYLLSNLHPGVENGMTHYLGVPIPKSFNKFEDGQLTHVFVSGRDGHNYVGFVPKERLQFFFDAYAQ